jgi:hypothetical protein
MLTTSRIDDSVYGAPHAGASGLLLKDAPVAELVRAVRVVAAGIDHQEVRVEPGSKAAGVFPRTDRVRRLVRAVRVPAPEETPDDRTVPGSRRSHRTERWGCPRRARDLWRPLGVEPPDTLDEPIDDGLTVLGGIDAASSH